MQAEYIGNWISDLLPPTTFMKYSSCLYLTAAIFVLFLSQAHPLYAQLSLNLASASDPLQTVDASQFPLMRSRIRATLGGNPIVLKKADILITDYYKTTYPLSIASPDASGYQAITWYSRSEGVKRENEIITNTTTFTITYNGESAAISGLNRRDNMSQIRFRDAFYNLIQEVYFGTVRKGQSEGTTIQVAAAAAKKDNFGREIATRLDSIVPSNPDFKIRWIGNYLSTSPPPIGMASAEGYYFDIILTPTEDRYYYETLNLYYEGGQKETLILRANGFSLPEKRTLTLLQPNGGVAYKPCQTIKLQWKGYIDGAPTYVDFSTNGGKTWDTLGSSMDSTYLWTVPPKYTDSGLLRIRQELQRFQEFTLLDPSLAGGVSKLCWNVAGNHVMAGYQSGQLAEWNRVNNTIAARYQINGIGFPIQKSEWLGIGFTADDSFAVVYRIEPSGEEKIALFTTGVQNPVKEISLTVSGGIKEAYIDRPRNQLIIQPKLGAYLLVYDARTAEFRRRVDLPAPVLAFTPGSNTKGAVSLMNSVIYILNMQDFSIQDSLSFPYLPNIVRLGISPDQSLLSLGTQTSMPTFTSGSASEVHVADIASRQIVRVLRKASSDAVGLTINSNNQYMGIGFAGIPQIALWQLPGNRFLGSVSGHDGFLTDIAFSPDGLTIASCALSPDNLKIRAFAYPEKDTTDAYFTISPANPTIINGQINPAYLMYAADTLLKVNFCNPGPGDIIPEYAYFRKGQHFSLAKPVLNTDTVKAGECLALLIRCQPADTGFLADSLMIGFCSQEFILPVSSYGKPRTIARIGNGKNIGSICVNQSVADTLILLRNADPVPLMINTLEALNGAVQILTSVNDTVLQPGQELKIAVLFTPQENGRRDFPIEITHSGQTKYKDTVFLSGEGLGADIQVTSVIAMQQDALLRSFTVKNNSANPVSLDSVIVPAGAAINIRTKLPVLIGAGQSIDIEFQSNELPQADITLETRFTPCARNQQILITAYSANGTLRLSQVQADPRGEAIVPVEYNLRENYPYTASRTAQFEITINPRLFLPATISSPIPGAQASIIRNQIVNDVRIIGISVQGILPPSGILAELKGPAGIAEVQEGPIDFSNQGIFLGTQTNLQKIPGTFTLINLCPDIRIIQQKSAFAQLKAIFPNPVSADILQIEISAELPDSIQQESVLLELYDALGTPHLSRDIILHPGTNSVQIVPDELPSGGTYRLILRTSQSGILSTAQVHILH
jgi:hypothetical protein